MHDKLDELTRAPHRIIFFSHQWTSRTRPDHTGEQYETMVAAIGRVVKANTWDVDRVWIWADYCSIPQRSRGMQKLAIASLAGYSSVAHAFVIVAPPVMHEDTGLLCDVRTYNRRMWCRAENLCHSMRNGTAYMWVATGTGAADIVKQADDEAFLWSNLRVFGGEATMEEDKLTLVVPILGLYAELYALQAEKRHALEQLRNDEPSIVEQLDEAFSGAIASVLASPPNSPPTSPPASPSASPSASRPATSTATTSAASTAATSAASTVLAATHWRRSFRSSSGNAWSHPKASRSVAQRAKAQRANERKGPAAERERMAAGFRQIAQKCLVTHQLEQVIRIIDENKDEIFPAALWLKSANSSKLVEHELFGPLLPMMEERIEKDKELRTRLVAQAVRRRSAASGHVLSNVRTSACRWRRAPTQRLSSSVPGQTSEVIAPGDSRCAQDGGESVPPRAPASGPDVVHVNATLSFPTRAHRGVAKTHVPADQVTVEQLACMSMSMSSASGQ